MTRQLDRRYARAKQEYTREELDIIADKYGLVSEKALSQQLQRSPNALRIAAIRHLHISRSQNFYTARNVSDELGIKCSKTITFWLEKGWITGKKSTVRAGNNLRWMFFEQDIESCLRKRPWLCHIEDMPQSYFRSIVKEEFDKDPWYSPTQVAPLLGLKTHKAIERYIHEGFLKADKAPGGPWQGRWIIRRSEIEKFLAKDPRPLRSDMCSKNKLETLRKHNRPHQLSSTWLVRCPDCRNDVLVMALPKMRGADILKRLKSYVNGSCNHGTELVLV